MMILFRLLALGLLAVPAAAQTYRLSDAEREAVQNKAALGPERAQVLTPVQMPSVLDRSLYPELTEGPARDRRIHGEVSVFAGTGGALGFAGTAAMPLGENGMASVSVAVGRLPGLGFGPGFGPGFGGGFGGRFGGDFGDPLGSGLSFGGRGRFLGRPVF